MRGTRCAVFLLLAGALIVPLALEGYSRVRVVRLSLVEGQVYVERPGTTAARGLVNLPLVEQAAVETPDGFAEVEFESGAFARLATGTRLEFSELGLLESGGRVTTLLLARGTATFSADLRRDDRFQVLTPFLEVSVPKKARFRVDVTPAGTRLRVFAGEVNVAGPTGPLRVSKGRLFEWYQDTGSYLLARNPEPDAWDEWNRERDDALTVSGPRAIPAHYRYGLFDLSHYGRWISLARFGWVWQPTVGPGWLPFSYGRWVWYPTFGWTWVSFEPWGWLPYHFGSWHFDSFYGWVWVPDYFAAWSPARCLWLQRAGWIGWAPLAPQRVSLTTSNETNQQPPAGALVVSARGFARGEVPRPAHEVRRAEGGWQLLAAPPSQLAEAVLRTRTVEAQSVSAGPVAFDEARRRFVNRQTVAPVAGVGPTTTEGARTSRRPAVGRDSAAAPTPSSITATGAPVAAPRALAPRPLSADGLAQSAPAARPRPEPQPRATFGSAPQSPQQQVSRSGMTASPRQESRPASPRPSATQTQAPPPPRQSAPPAPRQSAPPPPPPRQERPK